MKIEVDLKLPSKYDKEDLKNYLAVFSRTPVKAYTLNDDFEIVEGMGKIASDDSYNYHNNYDDSEDVMYFNTEQKYWTPSLEKIKEIQKENIERAIPIIEEKRQKLLNLLG